MAPLPAAVRVVQVMQSGDDFMIPFVLPTATNKAPFQFTLCHVSDAPIIRGVHVAPSDELAASNPV